MVVGAGAAGAAITWYLARAGQDVVCLELGDWVNTFETGEDFSGWESHRSSDRNPIPAVRQSAWDYPIDDSSSPVRVANFNAVGGSTVLFSGHFPRFLRRDFRIGSDEGVGFDWPIEYDSLLPFYDLNEAMMHVGGVVGDEHFPEIQALRSPVELANAGERMRNAFVQLDWHVQTSYASINTEPSNVLGLCRNLGPCNVGCPRTAKASADNVYMKPALEFGARLITKARVSRILMEGDSAVGVEYYDSSGKKKTERASRVVLAASAVGTPRVLLNSISKNFPNGLGNHSNQVGKNLMIHPMAFVEGTFDEDLDVDYGPQGCMVFSLEFHRVRDSDLDLGYMLHALRGDNPVSTGVRAAARRQLRYGSKLQASFEELFRRKMGIAVVVEDTPSDDSFLKLDNSALDSAGVPGVKVSYALSQNSKRLLSHGVKSARRVLEEAGAASVTSFAPLADTGWHTVGTARMGASPKSAVTDRFGRVFGTENVYVGDSSLFPSSSSVNPANTVQALALFIADNLVSNVSS